MTDPGELSAEEDARLAAFLREAGGPTPMPPDVAARLDGVVAGLAAERAVERAAPGEAEVLPLHRRRRRGRIFLGAAAAAVAGIFAVPALFDQAPVTQSSSDSGSQVESQADDQADGAAGGLAGDPPEAAPGDAGVREDVSTPGWRTMPDREARLVPGLGPVELDPDQLEADVLAALREGQRLDVVPPEPTESSAQSAAQCPEPALGPGESWSPAVYDGRRAVLVAAPEVAGAVAVAVRDCDGAELAAVTVELR